MEALVSSPSSAPKASTARGLLTVVTKPQALRTTKRVWLATDCDREGQLIGQEILEQCGYRGEVMRVLFTAQDQQTIRDAFPPPSVEQRPIPNMPISTPPPSCALALC